MKKLRIISDKLFRISFYLIIIVSISGCVGKERIDNDLSAVWNCSDKVNRDIVSVESVFPDIKAIGLEETEKSLVGQVSKIINCDSIYIILDSKLAKKIFLFDSETGKFIRSIGQTGGASGEYVTIDDISFDNETELLYALCDNNRVIAYSLDGEVIGENKIDFRAYAMEYNDGYYYMLSHDKDKDALMITDSNFSPVRSFFNNSENELLHQLVHGLVKNENGEIVYLRYLDNNIYRVNDKQELEVKYSIDFGENALTQEDAIGRSKADFKSIMESKRGSIKYFIENDKYAAILFFDEMVPCFSLLGKTDHSVNNYRFDTLTDSIYPFASPLEYCIDGNITLIADKNSIPQKRLINHNIEIGDNPVLYMMK